MAFVVKYTKAQYEAKITELEGYFSQLESHLGTMENLREQMYQFWNDENARKTGDMLNVQIRQVRNAMDRTKDMILLHRSAVEKLEGANVSVSGTITEALDILNGLGI